MREEDDDLLVAKRKDGCLFSLLDVRDKPEMLALRKRESFYCPVCGANVQMRLGRKRSWHFAHHSKARCFFEAEAESAYHLKGKKKLYQWLRRQHAEVKLEPYLTRLKQRPDLLLHTRPANTALEFQCASMEPALLSKRTQTFTDHGILPIWLLGGNRLKRIGASAFQVSQMDWLTLRKTLHSHDEVFLLYFCPESAQFATLTHVIPYSATHVFARLHYQNMSSFTLSQLYHATPDPSIPTLKQWTSLKNRWRLNAYRYQTRPHRFVQNLYPILSLFPPAAGLPTAHLHHIETPCFLWQSWLFYQFYLQWPSEKPIQLQDVANAFRTLVDQHIFQVRTLPFLRKENERSALLAYLQGLVRLRFLQEKERGVFYKLNEWTVPQSAEELHRLDAEYFAMLFEMS